MGGKKASTPALIKSLSGKRVVHVAICGTHSLALTGLLPSPTLHLSPSPAVLTDWEIGRSDGRGVCVGGGLERPAGAG